MLHRPAALYGATHAQTTHLAMTSHCAAPATAWRGRVVVAFMLVMGLAALDVAAALPAPSADPHLAAFFSFDSWLAPGEVFPDDSGNGWNLQLVAGAATSRASAELHAAGDAPALPKFGPGALSLSGLPGQFAICGIPIASDAAATFTASVWLNPTAGNGSSASPQVVVANRANDPNSDAPFWALERAGSAVRLSVRSAAQVTPSVSPPVHIPTGAWTHVAVSRSAAGAWVLYVDGVASYDVAIPGAVQLDAEDARLIVVGGRTPFAPAGATSTLAGMLDNLRLYSTTLSAADVAGLVTGDEAPPQPLALPGQGWEASFTMKERSWGSSVAGSFDQVWESTGSAFFDSVHRRAVRRSTQSLMDDAGNTLLAQGVNEYVIGSGDGFLGRMCSAAHCVCTFVVWLVCGRFVFSTASGQVRMRATWDVSSPEDITCAVTRHNCPSWPASYACLPGGAFDCEPRTCPTVDFWTVVAWDGPQPFCSATLTPVPGSVHCESSYSQGSTSATTQPDGTPASMATQTCSPSHQSISCRYVGLLWLQCMAAPPMWLLTHHASTQKHGGHLLRHQHVAPPG